MPSFVNGVEQQEEGPDSPVSALNDIFKATRQIPGTADAHEHMARCREAVLAAIIPRPQPIVQSLQLFPWNHTFPCGCEAMTVEWDRTATQRDDHVWKPKVVAKGGKRYRLCPEHGTIEKAVESEIAHDAEPEPEPEGTAAA